MSFSASGQDIRSQISIHFVDIHNTIASLLMNIHQPDMRCDVLCHAIGRIMRSCMRKSVGISFLVVLGPEY
jgi:hypothetical protein